MGPARTQSEVCRIGLTLIDNCRSSAGVSKGSDTVDDDDRYLNEEESNGRDDMCDDEEEDDGTEFGVGSSCNSV
jgi:hypothetical protein